MSQRDDGAQAPRALCARIVWIVSYIYTLGGNIPALMPAVDEDHMIGVLSATMVGNLVLAAAAPLPRYNVEPSCSAAAKRAGDASYLAVCMRKEQEARQQIQQQWRQFTSADKAKCMPRSGVFERGTYTELLTCLELARALRDVRQGSDATATGANPTTTPLRPTK